MQGDVVFQNAQLDDMVLLRSDGSPTYMHSVVVDDHDMGVTHVIRGDDHLTNAGRQSQLIKALGYTVPAYAHLPLIHGPDGAKLSKRHGAVSVEIYRDLGYLPEALRNYLARLGWAHGDDELFTTAQAIEWFTLEAINKAPSRLDFAKLDHVNGHYIRIRTIDSLTELTLDMMTRVKGWTVPPQAAERLHTLMPAMRERAKTIAELAESAWFLIAPTPLELDAKAAAQLSGETPAPPRPDLNGPQGGAGVDRHRPRSRRPTFAEAEGLKLGAVAQPLRAALTGRAVSPPIFDVMAALGRDEALARIAAQSRLT